MTLLAPIGLLFLLSVPAVILFYLLRVRLQQLEVGSTYLWERLLRDLSAQDPWQRPRFTLLMLIQILLLTLLALALARPAWQVLAQESVFEVIVLDASASMQATDIAPNRFAEARRVAGDAIRQLPSGSSVAIVVAKNRPEVLVPATGDLEQAIASLNQATPGSGALDVSAALRLANAIALGHTKGRVQVITDGAFDRPTVSLDQSVPIAYHLVGGGANNRAITAISARPDPQNNRHHQVFLRVQNFVATPTTVTLGIYADDSLVDSRIVSLAGSDSKELVFDRLPDNASHIQARLIEKDDLVTDDSASTVLERRAPTKILMVSAGNIFLQRALSLLPNVELYRTATNRYDSVDTEQFHLIVFDGYLPQLLPRQNLLVINPPDSPLLTTEGMLDNPSISAWESESPLLRYVSLQDVRIQRVQKVTAPGWAKTVVTADRYPLLLAGELGGQRLLVALFSLQQSNLPVSAAFPILIANAVGYLEPPGLLKEHTVAAGATINIQPLRQAEEVTITRPDGAIVGYHGNMTFQFDQTEDVGLYEVKEHARGEVISSERFAVNLTNESESNSRPRVPEDIVGQSQIADGEPAVTQREVWPWLVLAGLGILTGEWWWYHRRA